MCQIPSVRLTLIRAKEYLAHKAPADELNYRLNRVCERYILSGKFMGTMARLKLAAPFGQVALPRGYRTGEGFKVNGRVFEIGNRWWDFLPGKSDAFPGNLMMVNDLGDGHAVMYQPTRLVTAPMIDPTIIIPDFPPGQGTITVAYTGADSAKFSVHMEGKDINEMPITQDFAGPFPQTVTNPFARIGRIKVPQSASTALITYTAPNDNIYGGAVITLAMLEPNEEESYYRRYMIPTLIQQPTVAVEAFCKRRHIEFSRDTDILPFANVGALGLGLDAYELEANGDKTAAGQFWNDGIALLNAELGDANAEDTVPAIRFRYPGRTTPKLTSHF